MRTSKFVAMLAVLPLLFADPLAARTIFPPIGYQGQVGTYWDQHCPSDKFLVGFRIWSTVAIHNIKIVCASVSAGGGRGELWYGDPMGGSGGNPQEFTCPHDAVITGFAVEARKSNDYWAPRVVTIVGQCVSRTNGARTEIALGEKSHAPAPAQRGSFYPHLCPTGESGSGLNGRSLQGWLGAVGLDCAVRVPN